MKDDPVKAEMIEIYDLLAMSRNNPKRALKKLDKLYEDNTGKNEALLNYVYCCGLLESGNKTEARRYYEAVASSDREDLMSGLDDLMNNE